MPLYFAYGSNMSRIRLERRVGAVVDHGAVALDDYRHAFDKRGADGTAKGNIAPRAGGLVYGVVYELTVAQLWTLGSYEGGYRRVRLAVAGAIAATFRAARPTPDVTPPTAEYLAYYERGMIEHGIPRDYRDAILAGVGRR